MKKVKFVMKNAPKFLRKNMREVRLSNLVALSEILLDYIYFCAEAPVTKSDVMLCFPGSIAAATGSSGTRMYKEVSSAAQKAWDILIQSKAIEWTKGKKLVIGESVQ